MSIRAVCIYFYLRLKQALGHQSPIFLPIAQNRLVCQHTSDLFKPLNPLILADLSLIFSCKNTPKQQEKLPFLHSLLKAAQHPAFALVTKHSFSQLLYVSQLMSVELMRSIIILTGMRPLSCESCGSYVLGKTCTFRLCFLPLTLTSYRAAHNVRL